MLWSNLYLSLIKTKRDAAVYLATLSILILLWRHALWYTYLLNLFIYFILYNINKYFWGQSRRRGTKCDCEIDWLWVRFPLEEMKYLCIIFSFLRSAVEAKRGVEFRYSTRVASWILLKKGELCLNTRSPLPIMLCAGYCVKLI